MRSPVLLPLLLQLVAAPLLTQAQAPLLTTFSPGRNAVGAPRFAPVQLTFSQPMTAATATAAAVKAYGALSGARTGTFGGGGTSTINWQPTQPWLPGEKVTVNILAPAAQSTAGLSLSQGQAVQFTAAAAPATGRFTTGPGSTGSSIIFAASDLDGDGDVDIIGNAQNNGPGVESLLNDGTGHFIRRAAVVIHPQPYAVVSADFDQDGDQDAAVTCVQTPVSGPVVLPDSSKVVILLNDGTGAFTTVLNVPLPGWQYLSLTAADYDGDGSIDLAAGGYALLTILLNNGTATAFSSLNAFRPDNRPIYALAHGDVDNDGDIDVVGAVDAASLTADSISVWLNDGSGTFRAGHGVAGSLSMLGVGLADLNGDGALDAFSAGNDATNSGSFLNLRFNNGSGTFRLTADLPLPHPAGAIPVNPITVVAADLDGDGDNEVAVAGYNRTLHIARNLGQGQFAAPTVVAQVMTNSYCLAAADLNNDATLDLIYSDFSGVLKSLLNSAPMAVAEQATDQFSAYPNPATGSVHLTLAVPASKPTVWVVQDVVGRPVVGPQTIPAGERELTISLTQLAAGVYVVKVGTTATRLVVE